MGNIYVLLMYSWDSANVKSLITTMKRVLRTNTTTAVALTSWVLA